MKTFTSKLLMGCLAASGLALFVSGASLAGDGPRMDEAPAKTPGVMSGAEVYEKSCTKCHGADGKGDTGMGKKGKEKGQRWPDLAESKIERAKVFAVVKDGVADTQMKGYGEKLGTGELDAVVDYVIGLRK